MLAKKTKHYLLGIDVGTTGVKTMLIDLKGSVKAEAISEYGISMPRVLWAEQDPEEWWRATCESVDKALKLSGASRREIVSIGLTGQMHGLILLDKAGNVIRPCIMWNDQRAGRECDEIRETIGKERLLELTGNQVLPGFTAPKLLWVRNNEADIYKSAAKMLLPKDYIRFRFTGEYLSDVTDASGTALFDVCNRKWSGPVVKELGIQRSLLPDVTESIEISSRVSGEAAKETGLAEGTPVAGGAGDQAAQAVGAGIVRNGLCSVTIGTSGVVFVAYDKYVKEPEGRLHAFCHAIPGMWHLMGVMLSAGGSFKWYREVIGQAGYDELTDQAEGVVAGSDGLLFLPYLTGERTPYSDPLARGVFCGLTLRHGKAHMTRSVIEGVTFGLRDSLEIIYSMGCAIDEVRISGGGVRSALWRKIIADIFNMKVSFTNISQGAAYGVAIIAGVGVGAFDSIEGAVKEIVKEGMKLEPGKDAEVYQEYYEVYKALYPALRNEFSLLSTLAERNCKK